MVARLCIFFIQLYRFCLSPLKRPSCRFEPSCSLYAIHAIEHHGILKGSQMAIKRLFRCHPYSKRHGFDPVPPHKQMKHQ